jgi:hypothetical protein
LHQVVQSNLLKILPSLNPMLSVQLTFTYRIKSPNIQHIEPHCSICSLFRVAENV